MIRSLNLIYLISIVLQKAVGIALRELSFQKWPAQTEKIIQFHDTLLVRHGVMLIGPTGGGKSTVRKVLRKALTLLPSFYGNEDDDTVTIEGNDITDGKSILTHTVWDFSHYIQDLIFLHIIFTETEESFK